MDEKLETIINTMRIATADNEGVVVEPLGVGDGVLKVRYFEGTNEECPECVMAPDSFREMVLRLCETQAPDIVDVQVVGVE